MTHSTSDLAAASPGARLSEADFAVVQDVAQQEAGLVLPASKQAMVQSRISRRLRIIGCQSIAEYLARVGTDRQERNALISVLTTNVTSFFRETHHFQTLAEDILPDLLSRARTGQRLRIWSAGCSSGQEAYSLAMLIVSLEPSAFNLDIKILATDVDRTILKTARRGHYRRDSIQNLPQRFLGEQVFDRVDNDMISIPRNLKKMVSFKYLNLHQEWPMRGTFDIIMCRNVVIYFDAARQAALWPRFLDSLAPSGWLFLGHSERIHPLEGSGFVGMGLTAYRKDSAIRRTTKSERG